jgi:hypothetical protein
MAEEGPWTHYEPTNKDKIVENSNSVMTDGVPSITVNGTVPVPHGELSLLMG